MVDQFSILETLRSAEDAMETGDQGDAQALLTRALLACKPVGNEQEAIAVARSTELLIRLDAGLVPAGVLDEHIARMRRLTAGFDSSAVVVARAEAELSAVEWVHTQDDIDSLVLVEVLDTALAFAAREQGSEHEGARRAAAEAGFTAQFIRKWLGLAQASLAAGLESLAVGLSAETDARMRTIRLHALFLAAESRNDDDLDGQNAEELLRLVFEEASRLPQTRWLYYAASLGLTGLAIAAEVPIQVALTPAMSALHAPFDDDEEGARLRCGHLERVLSWVPADEREQAAEVEWGLLSNSYAAHPDPRVRVVFLEAVLYSARNAENVTSAGLRTLQSIDAVVRSDVHPETRVVRFRLAARIGEVVGHPDASVASDTMPVRDPRAAVHLLRELEARFPGADADVELGGLLAKALLERALRLSEIGESEKALAIVIGFRARFAHSPARSIRLRCAQADYWTGRLLRDAGRSEEARRAVEQAVAEYGTDPDPDVREWGSNALFSAWKDSSLTPVEADALLAQFGAVFGDDPDVRIRRRDASRRLTESARAHERGEPTHAVDQLQALLARFAEDDDPDIVDTVRLARENLRVLSLLPAHAAPPSSASEAHYRELRDRLYATDALVEAGRVDEAVREYAQFADDTVGATDSDIRLLWLAALDQLCGHLIDREQWREALHSAHRVMVLPESPDTRGERIRARAYLRFGIAQGRLGDARAAIGAYEALDALVASSRDDDIMTARQQAVYNRAVLLDDLGDVPRAIAAYDHVLAVHASSVDSRARRLRRVKALRNKAQLLDDLGRIAEAAGAHRHVLDIVLAAPDSELTQRARLSAFALGECFTRLGDHAAAAQTYTWLLSSAVLGFSDTDLAAATRARKISEKEARRTARRGR